MSIETQEVTIDGEVYRITPMLGRKGLAMFRRIAALVGDSFAAALADDGSVDIKTAVTILCDKLDPEVDKIIWELVETVTHNGDKINPDLHFGANYGILLKLIVEVVTINFKDAFPKGVFSE